MKRVGTRVVILGGMREFVGKSGRVVAHESRMCRVRLDEPVHVEHVGEVEDDLWESRLLKQVGTPPRVVRRR